QRTYAISLRIYSQAGYGVSARYQISNYQLAITNYPLPITNYQPRRQYKYSSDHDMKFISWRTKK
ncbi:hypothetical protein CEN46_00880, partial [Fischerella thermalis CCMEE 5318]